MKSIRHTLVVYFCGLLIIAMGAVSLLAYRNTESILEVKSSTRAQLLKAQYEDLCEREKSKLDDSLLLQARVLAGQAKLVYPNRPRGFFPSPIVPLPPVTSLPTGLAFLPVIADVTSMTLLDRNSESEIQFDEDILRSYADDQGVIEYFQINSRGAHTWRSKSMGERVFGFDQTQFRLMDAQQHFFSETTIEGIPVRRVTLKAPVAQFVGVNFFPQRRPTGRPRPGEPPPNRDAVRSAPSIYVQCAAETKNRDEAIAAFTEDLQEGLESMKKESAATLASLRNKLLVINLVAFAATILGGLYLVRLGLSPLERLTDAVSKVSPKDFKLPYEETRVPRELEPIVERLNGTLGQLKRVFAREKQAAADISHELRTPLAALLTTIEVALRKQRSPEEYREILGDCHAAGQQINKLVEKLLTLARLDAGVDLLRPREVDVASLTEQCANLVRPLAEARGLQLESSKIGPVKLFTDPDKFREIVTNLLHNAIEYNKTNGKVEISVGQHNSTMELEVKDTGIGIAQDAMEHIFERFYRADASRHADGMHAGLGLAIVKGYTDLMGGTISVNSVQGQGTTFRVRLPIGRPGSNPALEAAERN